MYSSQCLQMSTDWFLLSVIPHLAWDVSELCLAPEFCVDTLLANAACFSVFVWCWSWVWDRATTEFPFHLESSRVCATSLGQKCKWKSDAQLRWSVCVIAPLPSWVPVKDCRRVKATIHTKNCHLLLEVTIVSDKQHIYCKVSESDCYYHRIN